jgi:uncharacterized protein YwqG
MLAWLRSIFGANPDKLRADGEPSEADFQSARECLDRMVKPAVFGELGGETPLRDSRIASRWGGHFFGARDETVPVCQGTGRPMRPLVQIRIDELPEVPVCLVGLALLTIWVDLKAVFERDDSSGNGFVIRTYAALDGLVSIGPVVAESNATPILPIAWRTSVPDQPHWDDVVDEIPGSIAQSDDEAWFFESRYAAVTEAISQTCPVKLGGWPNWIQNSMWPDDAEFCFQVDSTDKGKFNLGDGGSLYIFRTPRGWASRSDCY